MTNLMAWTQLMLVFLGGTSAVVLLENSALYPQPKLFLQVICSLIAVAALAKYTGIT